MFKQKAKGWVPEDETSEDTVKMIHVDECIFLTKREAKEDIGENVKQVLLTVTCEDVKKKEKK